MKKIYKTYLELNSSRDYGIYRRIDDRRGESEIFIFKQHRPSDPQSLGEYITGSWPEGDDRYMSNEEDVENAPHITYEFIDDLENISLYLKENVIVKMKNLAEEIKDNVEYFRKDEWIYQIKECSWLLHSIPNCKFTSKQLHEIIQLSSQILLAISDGMTKR
jgi:hypothetical protein